MKSLYIALYGGSGVIGTAIRWQTRSQYAHAALVRGKVLIEAKEGKGVLARQLEPADEAATYFEVRGLTDEQVAQAWAFAAVQVHKGYDWTMVLRFVSRRQESRASTGKWFCSELVYAAFKEAGVDLLRETEPWEVSPGLLARSPLLRVISNPKQ